MEKEKRFSSIIARFLALEKCVETDAIFLKKIYLFEREKERERTEGRGRGRRREVLSRLGAEH